MTSGVVQLLQARSESDWSEARSLVDEYAGTLGVDLSFQDLAGELQHLRQEYAPPAGAFFLAIPAEPAYPRPSVELGAWLGPFLAADAANLDYNMVPSLHVAFATTFAWLFAIRADGVIRWAIAGWGVAIAVSTLLTHQHHLVDVAAGRFDGFWEQMLSAWDIAAGTLLIREAGGRVTDFAGRDVGVEHTAVVAGNPAIHAWLLEVLSSADAR